MAPHEENEDS
jgi:hypothetical protein